MEKFSLFYAFSGGALIGLSASLMILFNGRIAGISGICGGLIRPVRHDWSWRLVFLSGLIGGAFLMDHWLALEVSPQVQTPQVLLIIGGFLVGFGTRLGNGCTSGHAICGIARLSIRSIVATVTFMSTAAVTVYIVRHVVGASI